MNRRGFKVLTLVLLVTLVAVSGLALAKGPIKLKPPCPYAKLQCLDVWDPVTCDNGVTYSNACYALRACATGCTEGNASW